jgi:hypothetical protein
MRPGFSRPGAAGAGAGRRAAGTGWGRITTAPVRGSPGATVRNAYYANDLIASQEIAGVALQAWALDALGRFASYRNCAWAAGADGTPAWQEAVTKVNHYDSDSDAPAWIAEDASLPDELTRYVDGLDGSMAMETGKAGASRNRDPAHLLCGRRSGGNARAQHGSGMHHCSGCGPGKNARGSVAGTSCRIGCTAQALVNKLGKAHGCHTCGVKLSGTRSGNWVCDH